MGPSTWTCTQIQPFLRWRCGYEQKEMRSARRHASSKSTKMPCAAQHGRLVMLYLWRDLHIIECLRKPITAVEGHYQFLNCGRNDLPGRFGMAYIAVHELHIGCL